MRYTYVAILVLLCGSYSSDSAETGKVTEYQDGISTVMLSLRDVCTLSKYTDHVHCEKNGVTIRDGNCLTYDRSSNTLTLKECVYFETAGHNVTEQGFINLPENISELNDYMCGPMNRRGLLCQDCIDGYGLSWASVSYKCSNCSNAWYGVPLYLILQFVPITILYIFILFFRFSLTYAPMTCFIVYSQLFIFEVITNRDYPLDLIIPEIEHSIFFKLSLTFYGIWTTDFIRYIVTPFCVNSNIHMLHLAFLGFVSAFYPFLLIFLTWIYVQMNDRYFKPVV